MDNMELRREEIVNLINEKGEISFQQLKEKYSSLSEMTLRTDLRALDEQKRIVRIHGGAKSVGVVIGNDDLYARRAVRNVDAKEVVAKKAANIIKKNSIIFLDSGTTTTMIAKFIKDEPCIIYTSGITCLTELSKLEKPTVYMPGGELNKFSMSVCGIKGIEDISNINFDMAIIGTTNYSDESGFTCGSMLEAELKRVAIKKAKKKVIVMDSSKIGKNSAYTICNPCDINTLITDGVLPTNTKDTFINNGIEII